MTTKTDAVPRRWVNQRALQNLTGWSRQTLAEWARRPGCPRRRRGTSWEYALPDFLDWKEAEKVRAAARPAADIDEAKARKEAALAELAELDLAVRRGELVAVMTAGEQLEAIVARFRAKLLAAPPRYAPDLVGATTIPEAQAVLETAVHDLMGALAETADEPDLFPGEEEAA